MGCMLFSNVYHKKVFEMATWDSFFVCIIIFIR